MKSYENGFGPTIIRKGILDLSLGSTMEIRNNLEIQSIKSLNQVKIHSMETTFFGFGTRTVLDP